MGVDVELWVLADPSVERLEAAEKEFTSRSNIGDRNSNGHVLEIDIIEGHSVVRVNSLSRYYDGGKNGYWPQIYQAIRAMQDLFPESDVYYHGDGVGLWEVFEYGWVGGSNTDPYMLVTEKRLSEYWQAWLINDPYDGLEKDVAW